MYHITGYHGCMSPKTSQPAAANLHVTIITPEAVVYEGQVEALASTNTEGPFSMLTNHSNFISILSEDVVIYQNGAEYKRFQTKEAVLRAIENNIEIYLA